MTKSRELHAARMRLKNFANQVQELDRQRFLTVELKHAAYWRLRQGFAVDWALVHGVAPNAILGGPGLFKGERDERYPD